MGGFHGAYPNGVGSIILSVLGFRLRVVSWAHPSRDVVRQALDLPRENGSSSQIKQGPRSKPHGAWRRR